MSRHYFKKAEKLVRWLFRHPVTTNIQRARSVLDPWEKALPDDLHVRVLNLSAGEVSLDVEIQTDQGERKLNRRCALTGCLSGKSINNVLVYECGIAPREGVCTQFIE